MVHLNLDDSHDNISLPYGNLCARKLDLKVHIYR